MTDQRALLLNYAQVLCALVLHGLGAGIWFIFLPLQCIAACANARSARSRIQLIVLSLHHIVSTVIAHQLAFRLYYHFVSSDEMTLTIGRLGMVGGVIIVAAVSAVSIISHERSRRP